MNIVDRLTHWYANTGWGAQQTSPSFWSRRRSLYDSLSPSDQLEWRARRGVTQLLGLLILVLFVPVAGAGVFEIFVDGDRIPSWMELGVLGAWAVASLGMALFGHFNNKALRQRFALVQLPKLQVPDGLPKRDRFFWRIGEYMDYVWAWPSGTKGRYAAAYVHLSKDHRDRLMIASAKWFVIGLPAVIVPVGVLVTPIVDHVPYTVGLFVPLIGFTAAFLTVALLWFWRRRVLAERFAS